MRFAVFTDVQGNLAALEAVLADIDGRKQRLDRIVCAGDTVGLGPHPNEVIELLRSREIDVARGNYEDAVASDRNESGMDFADAASAREDAAAVKWTRSTLTPENLSYVRGLPLTLRLTAVGGGVKVSKSTMDGRSEEYRRTFLTRALFGGMVRKPVFSSKRVTVLHGSPRAVNEFIREDSANSILQAIARDADTDVLVFGHPGREFRREAFGVLFVGLAPVSNARDAIGPARYAVVTTDDEVQVEFRAVEYDPATHIHALRESGLPLGLADRAEQIHA